MSDIDERVREGEAKLKRHPPGHPDRASALATLSVAIDDRFRRRGGLKDINRCIELDSEAITLRPKGHDKYISSLNNLSIGLRSRFRLTGDPADLERSLEIDEEALALRPPGDPERANSLARLSVGLTVRFKHMGDLADIDRSIILDEEVIQLRQPDHPELADAYLNLSVAFFTRFRATKEIADLDRSIELDLQALALREGADRADSLASLAISVRTRFREFGDFADLQRSIDLDQEALDSRPPGHADRALSLVSLSIAFHLRYQRTGSLDDLDRSLELDEEVLELRPPEHPERGKALTSMSVSYHTRFQEREDMADLDRSLELDREALAIIPESHAERVTAIRDIAISLVVRFEYLHEQEDLREAMTLYKQAFSLLKPGHPSRFRILILISSLYINENNKEKDPIASVESLRAAMQESQIISQNDIAEVCNLLVRIQAQTAASEVQVKQPLLAAFRRFMSFLPRIAYLGMEMSSRLRVLNKTSEVTMSACLCALQLGCTRDALEILEEGRAVSWSQSLRLRSSFDDLPIHLSSKLRLLATKLEAVVNLKDEKGADSNDDDSDDDSDKIPTAPDAKAAYARKLTRDFEDTLTTARQLPGFESFLMPMSYPGLAKAAERGPVVILMAHTNVCYAIILRAPDANPEHISLPKLSTRWLSESTDTLRRSTNTSRDALPKDGRAMKKVESCSPDDEAYKLLEELWIKVCKPVIDQLGLQQTEGKDRRRVWWCPTGPFVFLPIHAAGIYKTGSADFCSRYMISSYTPTVAALSNAHRDFHPISRKAAQVLLAAVPYTSVDDDLEPLPNTVKEVETIREMIPAGHVLQLPDEGGLMTRYPSLGTRAIMDTLPAASILHFAGHGRQDLEQPLNSGFAMRDGMLTLAALMTFNLPNAFLAFLSACESAKGDPQEPDQTVHLAAAMLFTGFRSVVATMWSMNDFDGPTVARQVYEDLFHGSREHFEPDDVPYALDVAAHELRIAGAHPSRWATFIHLGI